MFESQRQHGVLVQDAPNDILGDWFANHLTGSHADELGDLITSLRSGREDI